MSTRTALTLSALAAFGLVLTGCVSKADHETATGPPTASAPSPTSTATGPPAPSITSPEKAVNAYLNYVDVRNEVGQDYYRDWQTKYLPLTTGEEMASVSDGVPRSVAQGYHWVGSIVVKTIPEVVDYDDTDPAGFYRAEMRACVDTSDVEFVSEGLNIIRATPDGRYYDKVVMRRIVNCDADGNVLPDPYGQGWWRVDSEHGDPEQPC